MKTRITTSSVILIFFAILAGGSVDEDGGISSWVWIAGVVVLVMALIGFVLNQNQEEQKKAQEAVQAKEAEKQAALVAQQAELYKQWSSTYVGIYGNPDKSIVIEENSPDGIILVHEQQKLIFLAGKMYPFADIISCSVTDDPMTIKGAVHTTTKTDMGSMLGRAIIGNMVAGKTGAFIGGSTASQTTEVHQDDDIVLHDYTVLVNVNSISQPLIRLGMGDDTDLANEVVSLLNVVIARK